MKLVFDGKYSANPRQLLRRCGYGEFVDPRTAKVSYARRLTGGFYPRFHAYIDDKDGGFQVNLHLDQKRVSYEGNHMHSGEYEGGAVDKEGDRINSFVKE